MVPQDQMLTNLRLRLEEKEEKIKEQQEEIELIKRQDRVDVLLADGFYVEKGKSLKENVVINIKYYFDMDIKAEQINHLLVWDLTQCKAYTCRVHGIVVRVHSNK